MSDLVTVYSRNNIAIFAQGLQGPQGAVGIGLPAGGTTGQVLSKQSVADYDTQWADSGVPYTGATNDVFLGDHSVITNVLGVRDVPAAGIGVIRLADGTYTFEDAFAAAANIAANTAEFTGNMTVNEHASFSLGDAGGQMIWQHGGGIGYNSLYVQSLGVLGGFPDDVTFYMNPEEGINLNIGNATDGYTAFFASNNTIGMTLGNGYGQVFRADAGGVFVGNGAGLDLDAQYLSSDGISGRRNAPLYRDNGGYYTGGSPITQVGLITQSAAKAATTLWAVPSGYTGMVRISFVAKVTRAATTSSILGGANGLRFIYTDTTDSVAVTTGNITNVSGATLTANTTQVVYSGIFVCRPKASTNLQYSFDYTSVGATAMQYSLHITAEPI